MLQKTHAGTGFMHESFHKDDPKKFTRSWFAWANTLFGELLWKTFNDWNTNHLINQCKQKFMRRITKFSLLLSLVLGLYFPTVFAQSNMTNEMFDLAKLKSGVKNKRISSTDPTGGNRDHLEPFKPGEKRIIADIKGAGAINHIWVSFGNALFYTFIG